MSLPPAYQSYEHLPVSVCVVAGGRVAYANPAFAALHGVARESVLGLALEALVARLVSPEDAAWLAREAARVGAGEAPLPEVWAHLARRQGLQSFVAVRSAPGPGAGEQTFLTFAADADAGLVRFVGALSSVGPELLRSRDERAAVERALDALYAQGITATVLVPEGEGYRHYAVRQPPEAVAAAERLYGRPLEQVVLPRAALPHVAELFRTRRAQFVQDFRELAAAAHPPEVAAFIRANLPPARSVEAPLFVGEQPFGVLSANSMSLTPVMSATIELFARQVGAAMENARAHRLAEERLRQLQALQGELVSRERLAALGEAAAVLAHEVRNPLAAILNGLSVLKRDPALAASSRGVLGLVEEESQRLEQVVHDLLDFTRPMVPRPAPLDLVELARHAVRVLRERGEAAGLRLEAEAAAAELPARGDAHLLHLALENLVRNALQASPPGGRVRVAADLAEGGRPRLTVEDEGPGVAEADRERVFEPFVTSRARGTGLGLPIVRRVAHAHGGEVRLGRSELGGARFELLLP